jgi:sec-independent protein translocase protein TatB
MFLEGKTLELMIAAIVALVVVGPKDLPVLLRRLGQFMARLRGMAAEFRASFDEMARQSELDELRKEVDALRKGQLAEIAAAAPTADINRTFDEIHQGLADVGVELNQPLGQPHAPPEPAPETIIRAADAAKPTPAPRAKPARPKAKASAKAPAKARTTKPAGKPRAPRAKTPGPKP